MDTLPKYSNKEFPEALGDALREKRGDRLGRFSLRAFLGEVEGYTYEGLRLQISGKNPLQKRAIEAMAQALDIDPHYFREYRMYWILEQMQENPQLIDHLHDAARLYVELHQPVRGRSEASQPQPDAEDDRAAGGEEE